LYGQPTRDPDTANLGVVFSHQDYLRVNGNWDQNIMIVSTIHIWINFVSGVPKEFADLRLGVSDN
jgi:hypothetical protein